MGAVLSSCCKETKTEAKMNETAKDNSVKIAVTPPMATGTPQIGARRASGTRVRRLSVVTAEQAKNLVDEVQPTEEGDAKKAGSTRNRRLSVVTVEEMKAKLELENAQEMKAKLETGETQEKNAKLEVERGQNETTKEESLKVTRVLSRSQSGKSHLSLESEATCVSRTGREPGAKKTNQDNCFAFEKFIRRGNSLFAAFDGHGSQGHTVSSFVKHHLPLVLTQQLNKLGRSPDDDQIKQVLSSAFLEVQESLMNSPIDIEFSGTTATIGYLIGRKLFVAWVGDSRCVLALSNPDGVGVVAKDLTTDHKPDTETERARIEAAGGRVQRLMDETGAEIGPWRVWAKYAWLPGLAMSRALGDECAQQMGVSSEPDVSMTELHSEASFAIFASDGVWEFVSSQEAVEIVHNASDLDAGCRKLIDESYQRWLMEENGVVDDITAVVVKFTHFTDLEKPKIAH